jgi:large subunit ribosomal protein L25
MAQQIKLTATTRKETGKEVAKKLRREGMLPGVIYGQKTNPIPLTLELKPFLSLLGGGKSESKLINLSVEGNGGPSEKTVMIKELQIDPLTRNYLHVDFFEISMDEEVTLSIPIVLTGDAVGVEMGGVLQQVRRELEIKCLPSQIPESISVDVGALNIGDSIHLKDVSLPSGIKVLEDEDLTIVTILAPTVEKEPIAEEVEEAEAAEAGAEEKKPEEEKQADEGDGGGKDKKE